jgi:hypothetical protein
MAQERAARMLRPECTMPVPGSEGKGYEACKGTNTVRRASIMARDYSRRG